MPWALEPHAAATFRILGLWLVFILLVFLCSFKGVEIRTQQIVSRSGYANLFIAAIRFFFFILRKKLCTSAPFLLTLLTLSRCIPMCDHHEQYVEHIEHYHYYALPCLYPSVNEKNGTEDYCQDKKANVADEGFPSDLEW